MHDLPLDTIDYWKPHQFREHDAISTQTRLFTSRTQVINVDPIPFDVLVDSNENLTWLARLSGARFIHTSDNEVEYLGPTNGGTGWVLTSWLYLLVLMLLNRMVNVSPDIYRVGDIVELSVSFVVWPSARGKSRMNIQLQSMRLLNKEETNVSCTHIRELLLYLTACFLKNARMKAMIDSNRRQTNSKLALPKRKRTYTREEEIAEAQLKLSKMRIDKSLTLVEPLQIRDTVQHVNSENSRAFSM